MSRRETPERALIDAQGGEARRPATASEGREGRPPGARVDLFAPGLVRQAGLALALAATLAGCGPPEPRTIPPEQMSQANLQADLGALKSRNQELRQRLEEIEAVLGRQGRGFTLEDVNARLAQLEQTVARMAATLGIDAGPRAASTAEQQQRPEAVQPESRPKRIETFQTEPSQEFQSGSRPRPETPLAPERPPVGPIVMGPDASDPAEAILNMAMEAYNQRDYDRANTLFSELSRGYPSSRHVPAALFWQAESNYQQGDYGRAALLCQDLIQKYPSHPLAASAMLKQAQSFRKLGKVSAARILLQDVEKRYPGSPEARSAATILRELR